MSGGKTSNGGEGGRGRSNDERTKTLTTTRIAKVNSFIVMLMPPATATTNMLYTITTTTVNRNVAAAIQAIVITMTPSIGE